MDITIGKKIRELRRARELTQEELADKLGISSQAVSKWENGTCYPDMEQIPVLAGFFGVSLDLLFGYDVKQMDEKIDELITEAKNWFWRDIDVCMNKYLDALKSYPGNEKLMTQLLEVYLQRSKNVGDDFYNKAFELATQISEDTKDIFLCMRAKSVLIDLYSRADDYNKMKEIIDTLPEVYPYMLSDKMRESSYVLKGEDRLRWAKDWKIIEIQELYISCDMEGQGYYELGKYEDALASFSQYRRVIEVFLKTDKISLDSYLWSGMQTHHYCAYLREAACLLKLGRKAEAKEKVDYGYYIISHAWISEDGSVDYFNNKEDHEECMSPFRQYYSEWGLDEFGSCPW